MVSWKKNPVLVAVVGLLIGVAAWSLHSMGRQGAGDILIKYGIDNAYYQNLIVIIAVLVIVVSLYGISKAKKIWTG